jgi:DNA-binding SARP family transcriptional activator
MSDNRNALERYTFAATVHRKGTGMAKDRGFEQVGVERAGAALRVFLLGPAWAESCDGPLLIRRRQARALLYCLASKLQPVPREEICFGFWADKPEGAASRYLSHLLSHLRTALGTPDLIRNNNDTLDLDPSRVWSDAVAFRAECNLPDARNIVALERAVELYRGPFLSGFSLPAAAEFELWVTEQRSLHERIYLDALAALIEAETTLGDYSKAILYARRYLRIDDLAEDIHRKLMVLHVMSGDRPAALQQYDRCACTLQRELGVQPLPETRAIHNAIRQNS